MKRTLSKIKVALLRRAVDLFVRIPRIGKKSRIRASHVQYRRIHLGFSGLSDLQWVSLLFLTDPHIGWNIDGMAEHISEGIHTLLGLTEPKKTFILHGGDFVSGDGVPPTEQEHFFDVAPVLFRGLETYRNFAVIGNHDEENPDFPRIKQYLTEIQNIKFLTQPRDTQRINIGESQICIYGIHTLADHLSRIPKIERNATLDTYIYLFNTTRAALNVVLLHNPDGMELLLRRLRETKQTIMTPTLFLAGHTHGGGLDIPFFRKLGLMACKTRFGRYKGWYGPAKKYAHTGSWKMYVSTGMGNSPDMDIRMNADPEVVLFTL